FLTFEGDQGPQGVGADLNDDGDADDLVLQVLNVAQACHAGLTADTCHVLASTSTGLCTNSGNACVTNASCCPPGNPRCGAVCFLPPGGCTLEEDGLLGLGPACVPFADTCNSGAFCQPLPGLAGKGVCKRVVGPCVNDADCTAPAQCEQGAQGFQRLV